MGCLVELVNVSKSLGGVEVLRGINLCVSKGEKHVIRGRSGVGKTTLLKIIALLLRPDGGRVAYRGNDYWLLPPNSRDMVRMEISYIPQDLLLIPHLTVFENIALPLRIRGVKGPRLQEKVVEVAEALGIKHILDKSPSAISGGEKQRVAIARALVSDPVMIVADEPTAFLDDENSRVVYELFAREAHSRGVAVVVSSTSYEKTVNGDWREHWLVRGELVSKS